MKHIMLSGTRKRQKSKDEEEQDIPLSTKKKWTDNNCQVPNIITSTFFSSVFKLEKFKDIDLHKKVMSYLTAVDLKNCRTICKSWKEWATDELLKRDCLQIKLSNSSLPQQLEDLQNSSCSLLPTSDFYFFNGDLSSSTTLKFFSEFGHQIKTLTFVNVKTGLEDEIHMGIANKEPLNEILHLSAPFIEHLCLDPYFCVMTPTGINMLKVGHGKILYWKKNPRPWDRDEHPFPWDEYWDFNLPHLKRLTFLPKMNKDKIHQIGGEKIWTLFQFSVGYKILMGAPNLVALDNFWLENKMHLKDIQDKLKLLKSVQLHNLHSMTDIEALISVKPQLECLTWKHNRHSKNNWTNLSCQVVKDKKVLSLLVNGQEGKLNKLLKYSKDSLKILELHENLKLPFLQNNSHKILKFKNLHTLKIRLVPKFLVDLSYLCNHPNGNSLQKSCPNLIKVTILLDQQKILTSLRKKEISLFEQVDSLPNFFTNKIPSVKELELTRFMIDGGCGHQDLNLKWKIPNGFTKRIKEFFPNVEKLVIKNTTELISVLPAIFDTFPNLHHLTFCVYMGNLNRMDRLVENTQNLDSTLTGYPQKICEGLKDESTALLLKQMLDLSYISDEIGKKPGLSSLTRLKSLDIIFPEEEYCVNQFSKCPISVISFNFATQRMLNLKITIRYNAKGVGAKDLEKLLSPIAAHVHFGSVPTDFQE